MMMMVKIVNCRPAALQPVKIILASWTLARSTNVMIYVDGNLATYVVFLGKSQ